MGFIKTIGRSEHMCRGSRIGCPIWSVLGYVALGMECLSKISIKWHGGSLSIAREIWTGASIMTLFPAQLAVRRAPVCYRATAATGSWPLFSALFISFLLGTAYSINTPMLRWKRFALVAAMCILVVRAVIVQIAFYLHIQVFLIINSSNFPKPVIFATGFMSFFSVVIALFKDIPDIVGDNIFGIQSFTVRLGQKHVFWTCILLLEVAYAAAILVGASSPFIWSRYITISGHVILGLLLWGRAKSTDLESKSAITSFYMFIWQLFYAEYLLIPLVR
ncbi:homogentisate phytyltransferase 1, chloroplastic-like [Bidens hawaiensis]|uniref:homogentisate phytyltransferase 1, chloroplastic-like n=1 Tax=Bidens hawaiensis TaxID=980011 RepID=UPI00404A151D